MDAALAWFRRGDASGHSFSTQWLGFLHERGIGVRRSVDAAADFYRRARQRGHPEAARALTNLLGHHPELRRKGDPAAPPATGR